MQELSACTIHGLIMMLQGPVPLVKQVSVDKLTWGLLLTWGTILMMAPLTNTQVLTTATLRQMSTTKECKVSHSRGQECHKEIYLYL